jgi:hypothetical protein
VLIVFTLDDIDGVADCWTEAPDSVFAESGSWRALVLWARQSTAAAASRRAAMAAGPDMMRI